MEESLKNQVVDYYKKKGDYNKKLQARKEKIMTRKTSIEAKQKAIKRLKLPCIFCKRNVNTIFEIDFDIRTARCGDQSDPCEGKIEINDIIFSHTEQMMREYSELVNILKQRILQLKYQTLFSYLSRERSSEEFTKLLKEYNDDLSTFIILTRKYTQLKEQKDTNDMIRDEVLRIQDVSKIIRFSLDQYNETNEMSFLKEGIDTMVESLNPIMNKLRDLKYAHREILSICENGEKKVHYLITRPYPFEAELTGM
mgnify:FL=1